MGFVISNNPTGEDINLDDLVANTITDSGLTATHVIYAGTAGLLSGEAAFAYNASTNALTVGTVNGLTPAALATGFTLAGGATSKTLTVELDSLVNQDLTTDASPTHVTVKLSGLTDTYVPYHAADATGLADTGLIYTSATKSYATSSVVDSTTDNLSVTHTAPVLQDGSASTGTSESYDNLYEAVKITASGNHAFRSVSFQAKATGTITNPTATITAYLYSDVTGSPGAVLWTGAVMTMGSLTASFAEYNLGTTTTYTMASGTAYWVVLKQSAAPTGGTIELNSVNTGTAAHAKSADGSAWTLEDSKTLWVKIYGKTGTAIYGLSTNSYGVRGSSTNSYGVYGSSTNSYGVRGLSTNS
jgi:hypothetical protein